jgi:uncharacterized RDD family membrane protein YckC
MSDNLFEEFDGFSKNVEFATFWTRAGAYILDGLIIGSITFSLSLVNIAQFKSFFFYLILTLISMLYKPYMESEYGATLGKMILKIKVTDYAFNQITFHTSLMRSAILVFPGLLYIPIYYFAFSNPNITEADGFMEFSQLLAYEYPIQAWIGNLIFLIVLVDIIVLMADATKTQRSLHDQIAKTYVIHDKK